MMNTNVKQQNGKRFLMLLALGFAAAAFSLLFCAVRADARTITITDPQQLKDLNWSYKGFGPGNTYIIGGDMTLGGDDDSTCVLTKGKFVIDLNGHTVQNDTNNLTVFHISGADVTIKDSKVKTGVPGIRSYGAGAVQITSGKLTIQNGNYLGAGDGTNNPTALHVGGGTCIVNGGEFAGEYVGASVMGGTLYINNGIFEAGYSHALLRMGLGNIHIAKGTFVSGTTTYGYRLALGSYIGNGEDDFNNWLAKGSSFDPSFEVGYWNMQSSVTTMPSMSNIYAVSWNTPVLEVKSTAKSPATTIKSVTPKKKALTVKWKKKGSAVSGYKIQYSTSKKFKKAKTITVKGGSKGAVTIKKLKSKQKYYVRIRTYRKFNGTTLYSGWSKASVKKAK